MKNVVGMALCLLLVMPCFAQGASGKSGVSVTPLEDEFAGQSAPLFTPPGPKGAAGEQAAASGSSPAPERGPTSRPDSQPGSQPGISKGGKDAVVVAYLIDLARKQDKPCPSGARLPVPPSLTFSEPLCQAAQAARGGAEPLAAMEEQGMRAVKWRMFSAKDAPAQRVVNGLRAAHCEALLEPYTHIGAYRDSSGWSILLATFADGSAGKAEVPPAAPATAPAVPASAPAVPASASAAPATAPAVPATPPGVSVPAAPGVVSAIDPAAESAVPNREAGALLRLLNELRAKGGTCFGNAMPPASALAFSPELQAAAEKDIRAGYGENSQFSGGQAAGALYKGSNMTKLALKANNHASVALDVWMVSPSQCEALLSPIFTEAGAAYEDGRWVLILGGTNEGVPSDK